MTFDIFLEHTHFNQMNDPLTNENLIKFFTIIRSLTHVKLYMDCIQFNGIGIWLILVSERLLQCIHIRPTYSFTFPFVFSGTEMEKKITECIFNEQLITCHSIRKLYY